MLAISHAKDVAKVLNHQLHLCGWAVRLPQEGRFSRTCPRQSSFCLERLFIVCSAVSRSCLRFNEAKKVLGNSISLLGYLTLFEQPDVEHRLLSRSARNRRSVQPTSWCELWALNRVSLSNKSLEKPPIVPASWPFKWPFVYSISHSVSHDGPVDDQTLVTNKTNTEVCSRIANRNAETPYSERAKELRLLRRHKLFARSKDLRTNYFRRKTRNSFSSGMRSATRPIAHCLINRRLVIWLVVWTN